MNKYLLTGSYLPELRLTNRHLEQMFGSDVENGGTTDEWIRTRTGMRERPIARPGETLVSMAVKAAQQALDRAGLPPSAIDEIRVATNTAAGSYPTQAALLQHALGASTTVIAYDVLAACGGFVAALRDASNSLQIHPFKHEGNARNVGTPRVTLTVATELLTRNLANYGDRGTAILFGDGAAALLQVGNSSGAGNVLSFCSRTFGDLADVIRQDTPKDTYSINPAWFDDTTQPMSRVKDAAPRRVIRMDGRRVYKEFKKQLPPLIAEAVAIAGKDIVGGRDTILERICAIACHQPNGVMLDEMIPSIAEELEMTPEWVRARLFMNVQTYGNLSTVSTPLVLDELATQGKLDGPGYVILASVQSGIQAFAGVMQL